MVGESGPEREEELSRVADGFQTLLERHKSSMTVSVCVCVCVCEREREREKERERGEREREYYILHRVGRWMR